VNECGTPVRKKRSSIGRTGQGRIHILAGSNPRDIDERNTLWQTLLDIDIIINDPGKYPFDASPVPWDPRPTPKLGSGRLT